MQMIRGMSVRESPKKGKKSQAVIRNVWVLISASMFFFKYCFDDIFKFKYSESKGDHELKRYTSK